MPKKSLAIHNFSQNKIVREEWHFCTQYFFNIKMGNPAHALENKKVVAALENNIVLNVSLYFLYII